jgi:hypothetical protein
MNFISCSSQADNSLAKFFQFIDSSTEDSISLLHKKINLCDFPVLLVTNDRPELDRLGLGGRKTALLETLFDAWNIINDSQTDLYIQENAWKIIDQIGEVVQSDRETLGRLTLRRFRNNSFGRVFFILLTGNDNRGIPVYKLAILCNLWKLEQGYLPIHAAGVVRRNKLFLFAGPSGAGKSTVARLSQEVGGTTLDEDQLLIHQLDDGRYSADAWGYNIDHCDVPLHAIFRLNQDSENRLIPSSPMDTARFLINRNNDVIGFMLSDEILKLAYTSIAKIARKVPCFDLYFSNGPDFWKLIDEQFPD